LVLLTAEPTFTQVCTRNKQPRRTTGYSNIFEPSAAEMHLSSEEHCTSVSNIQLPWTKRTKEY
jgi:hypothetical protein